MLKKMTVFIVLVIMVFNMTFITTYAKNSPKLQVTSMEGTIGDRISVQLVLTNPEGLKTIEFKVMYDQNQLSLNNDQLIKGIDLKDWTFVKNVEEDLGRINIVAIDEKGITSNEDIVVATANFTIKNTAKKGLVDLEIEQLRGFYDVSVAATFEQKNGQIKVKDSTTNNNGSTTPDNQQSNNGNTIKIVDASVPLGTAGGYEVKVVVDKQANGQGVIDQPLVALLLENHKTNQMMFSLENKMNLDSYTVTLKADALASLNEAQVKDLQINTEYGDINIRSKGLAYLKTQSGKDLKLRIHRIAKTTLPETVRKTVAGDWAYDVEVLVEGVADEEMFKQRSIVVRLPIASEYVDEAESGVICQLVNTEMEVVKTSRKEGLSSQMVFVFNESGKYWVSVDTKTFEDIDGIEWAKESIEGLATRGIINGVGQGNFMPNNNVTRAEFLKMVLMTLDIDSFEAKLTFTDVSNNEWYYHIIAVGETVGIIETTGNLFRPDEAITREDMAEILYQGMKKSNCVIEAIEKEPFIDIDKVAMNRRDAVGVMQGIGLINGYGDKTYKPLNNATRAEVSKLLYEMIIDVDLIVK